MKLKKAAMFGLDARIALAIFGALSVISGAALYSAIQQVNVESLKAQMLEFGKAWEQYYLDTGQDLPKPWTRQRRTNDLIVDSGVVGWNGPYIGFYSYGGNYAYYDPSDNTTYAHLFSFSTKEVWGDDINPITDVDSSCDTTSDCHIWISFSSFKSSESFINAMDENIDGSDGPKAGKFRWGLQSAGIYSTFYQYAPISMKIQN